VAAVAPLPPVQLSSEPSPESSPTPAAELERRFAPVPAAAPASVGDASAAVGTYTGFCRSFRENQGVLEDSSWEFGDDGDSSGEFWDDDFEFSPAFVYDRKGDLDGYDLGCADDEGLVLASVAMPPPSETVDEGETFRPAAIQAAAEPETSSVSVRGVLAKRRAEPAAAPVPPIDPLPPKEGFDIHVMTEEDRTLSNLSRTLGLPLADLLAANPQITDPDRIRVGQPLYVPVRPEPDSRAVP
jgi:LysM repeat protein